MSTVAVETDCRCGTLSGLYKCEVHHRIFRDGKRLASVGRIISTCWPKEKCKSCGGYGFDHQPNCIIGAKIENAKERGSQVDALFSAYVIGKLDRIPAGTRTDVYNPNPDGPPGLFQKLQTWFHKQNFKTVESQILVGDDEVGGILDLRFDGMPVDLKCTYNVEDTHVLQVTGYSQITGDFVHSGAAILHVTERLPQPSWHIASGQDWNDWRTMRNHWEMLNRRGAIKALSSPED